MRHLMEPDPDLNVDARVLIRNGAWIVAVILFTILAIAR